MPVIPYIPPAFSKLDEHTFEPHLFDYDLRSECIIDALRSLFYMYPATEYVALARTTFLSLVHEIGHREIDDVFGRKYALMIQCHLVGMPDHTGVLRVRDRMAHVGVLFAA